MKYLTISNLFAKTEPNAPGELEVATNLKRLTNCEGTSVMSMSYAICRINYTNISSSRKEYPTCGNDSTGRRSDCESIIFTVIALQHRILSSAFTMTQQGESRKHHVSFPVNCMLHYYLLPVDRFMPSHLRRVPNSTKQKSSQSTKISLAKKRTRPIKIR